MSAFKDTKEEYERFRENEREKIKVHLEKEKNENSFPIEILDKGLTAGKGKDEYTSNKRFKIPYDYSNWKWVEVKLNQKEIMITLQAFEGNDYCTRFHVLMDRIGIIYSHEDLELGIDSRMIATNIDLPMDEEKLEQLVKILKNVTGL